MNVLEHYECFFCEQAFEYRPHSLKAPQFYPVRQIKAFGVNICRRCATDQLDGVLKKYEKRLIKELNAKGVAVPQRNSEGRIPLTFTWTSVFAYQCDHTATAYKMQSLGGRSVSAPSKPTKKNNQNSVDEASGAGNQQWGYVFE